MPNRVSKFDKKGLWLAIPAVVFLVLYMSAQQFTMIDHVIAFVFVGILAYGTYSLQQEQHRQRRQQMRRAVVRDSDHRNHNNHREQ
jgi:hypothetical protein